MKKYLLLSLATVALVACTNSPYDGPDVAGGKLAVTGSVNQIVSRASGAAWDKGDQIGLSSTAGQDNVLYVTAEGDGIFTSTVPVYVLGSGEKTYTAYYPYDAAVNAENAEIKFTTPNDYMWASTTATRENPHANFVFKHKMSKIGITITDNTPGANAEGATIKIDGVAIAGSFNTLTGAVVASDVKASLTSPFALGSVTSFILPVQTVGGDITVTLFYNSKAYVGKIQMTDLAESTEYHYTIDLTSADPAVELSISSATITDWNKTEGGVIDVTEQEVPKEPNVLEVGDFLLKDGSVIDKNDRDFADLKNQVAGVVYYVGNPQPSELYGYATTMDILLAEQPNCTNGLAIAINDANGGVATRFCSQRFSYSDWYKTEGNTTAESYISTNLNLTSAGERMLGYNNTKIVEKVAELDGTAETTGVTELLALLTAYNTETAVTGASDWYVPSYAELKAIVDNYDVVSASIVKAGGSLTKFDQFGTAESNSDLFYWSSDLRGSSYAWVSPMFVPAETVNLFLGRNSNSLKGFFRLSIAF